MVASLSLFNAALPVCSHHLSLIPQRAVSKAQKRYEQISQKEAERKERVNALIPVSERLEENKESAIISKWEERQRYWDNYKKRIAKKLNTTPGSLVISKADEYREQMEEYQVIQSAIPAHERYGANYWEMSLRGIGSRTIPIGNIFSGLFCPIKETRPPPKIVRRPNKDKVRGEEVTKAANKSGSGATKRAPNWRDSKVLNDRKRELYKSLSSLRPYEVHPDHAHHLSVHAEPLFEWASTSSQAYFDREDMKLAREANKIVDSRSKPSSIDANGNIILESTKGPKLTIGAPEILFQANTFENVAQSVDIVNSGTTALFYEWTSVSSKTSVVSENRPPDVDTVEADAQRFFCHDNSGVLLPGQSKSFVFGFLSSTPGSYSQVWHIATTPEAAVSTPAGAVTTPSLCLRGLSKVTDNSEHLRTEVRNSVSEETSVIISKKNEEDIVTSIVRPTSDKDIRNTQRSLFLDKNYSKGSYFSDGAYDEFVRLFNESVAAAKYIASEPEPAVPQPEDEGSEDYDDGEGEGEEDGDGGGEESTAAEGEESTAFETDAGENSTVTETPVPVVVLENGVTSAWGNYDAENHPVLELINDIEAGWDGDVDSIGKIIAGLMPPEPEPEEPEPTDEGDEEEEEEEEEEEDDDDDDDDEEEEGSDDEEEEEDEEGDEDAEEPNALDKAKDANKPAEPVFVPPPDPRYVLQKELLKQWENLVGSTSMRPTVDAYKETFDLVASIGDSVVEAVHSARAELEIPDDQIIAPLASFFTSEDGLNEWNRLNGIAPPEQEEEDEGEVSPRTKAARAAAKPPLGPQNPEEEYRLLAYKKLSQSFGEMSTSFVGKLQTEDRAMFKDDVKERGTFRLDQKATLRSEDISGKVVLLHVDLDVTMKRPETTVEKIGPGGDHSQGEETVASEWIFDRSGEKKIARIAKQLKKICKEAAPPKSVVLVTRLSDPVAVADIVETEGGSVDVSSVYLDSDIVDEEDSILIGESSIESVSEEIGKSNVSTAFIAEKLSQLLVDVVKKEGAKKVEVVHANNCMELLENLKIVEGAILEVPIKKAEDEEEDDDDEDSDDSRRPMMQVQLPSFHFLERLNAGDLVPPLPEKEEFRSEDDDDELDVGWEKEEEVVLQETVGSMLSGVVDVVVCDDPKALVRGVDCLSDLVPTSALRLMGKKTRAEIASVSYMLERAQGSVVAVIGGAKLGGKVKLLDHLLDVVDKIAVTGGLAVTMLAAMGKELGKTKYEANLLGVAKSLMKKAKRNGVDLILPTDLVCGNILVDGNGVVGKQRVPIDEGEEEEDEKEDEDDEEEETEKGGEQGEGGQPDGSDEEDEEDEEEDDDDDGVEEFVGYDYMGDTSEAMVNSDGVPEGMYAMDLGGSSTSNIVRMCSKAKNIVLVGVSGVVECNDFRKSTSDIVSEVAGFHNGNGVKVLLCGETLVQIAKATLNDEVGEGVNVSHACNGVELCTSLLSGIIPEGVRGLSEREPSDDEIMLIEDLLKKYPELAEEEEEEEDEDDEDDDDDEDDSDSDSDEAD